MTQMKKERIAHGFVAAMSRAVSTVELTRVPR
jgi:hypothetical protein